MDKQNDDWGINANWDTGTSWKEPNYQTLKALGISKKELEPGYNDLQEVNGDLAWAFLDAREKQGKNPEKAPKNHP